ncbi:RNA polymerase sigma factor [Paraburkholderia sp. JHI869]|uniref:RNA polymerase sigma factor n=1 Tax=Paraburkholderia sp. JHI869 TaxID=3112959 RepID=UPI00317B156B
MKPADLSPLLPDMLPRLWSFAFRLSRSPRNAEEIVRRACVRGLDEAYRMTPGMSALTWMLSLVYSTWLKDMQRDTRSLAQWSGRPGESRVAMIDAVERLPEPQRVVLLLACAEGLCKQEVAEVLAITVGTVASRLFHGLATASSSPDTNAAQGKVPARARRIARSVRPSFIDRRRLGRQRRFS